MEWFNIFMARLRALFRRESVLQDIEEELRIHVEVETETNIKRGMPPDEARAAALKSFGDPVRNTELGYDIRGGGWLETLWQDLRYGARMLMKKPGFTLVTVTTLALGLGANAAIFSFVNAVLLKPLPYPDPERIVSVWETRPGGGSNPISTLNFLDWERQNRCFQFLSAITGDTVTLTGSDSPEQLYVQRVSASYFKALGVEATLGRTFAASENEVGNDLEVVLSNRIWQSRFGGDPKVIGRKITLDAKSYTIIGVLPANSTFDRTGAVMWLPLAFTPPNMTRNYHWLYTIARLEPGVTLKQARDQMDTIGARIAALYPDSNKGWGPLALGAARSGGSRAADRVRQCRQYDPGAGYGPRTRDRYSFSIGRAPSPSDPAVAYGKYISRNPRRRGGPRAGQCINARNETVVAA